jgi:hypothetical protein
VDDIGLAIKRIDSRRPQAANVRTGRLYQPGIGPHPETKAVDLIVNELPIIRPERYERLLTTGISYPHSRQHRERMAASRDREAGYNTRW